jgi:hypothetical protein
MSLTPDEAAEVVLSKLTEMGLLATESLDHHRAAPARVA